MIWEQGIDYMVWHPSWSIAFAEKAQLSKIASGLLWFPQSLLITLTYSSEIPALLTMTGRHLLMLCMILPVFNVTLINFINSTSSARLAPSFCTLLALDSQRSKPSDSGMSVRVRALLGPLQWLPPSHLPPLCCALPLHSPQALTLQPPGLPPHGCLSTRAHSPLPWRFPLFRRLFPQTSTWLTPSPA